MFCFKNGMLSREQFRDVYADGHWTRFNELVEQRAAGNNGYMGLYLPEIISPNVQGTFYFTIAPAPSSVARVAETAMPTTAHPRAILESQLLSIRRRIAAILPPVTPRPPP